MFILHCLAHFNHSQARFKSSGPSYQLNNMGVVQLRQRISKSRIYEQVAEIDAQASCSSIGVARWPGWLQDNRYSMILEMEI
jgi:hypothetical protein